MIPLYNRQIKSSRELQELQPELRRLQSEYPGRENREALAYAQQDLYKEHGVNPYASFVPLLIQFPILMERSHECQSCEKEHSSGLT